MHILHGTWIPQFTDEFVQAGAFWLWVETASPRTSAPGYSVNYLPEKELKAFLVNELAIAGPDPRTEGPRFDTRYVLLPTVDGKPSPSPELARRLDAFFPEDAHTTLMSHAISACSLPNVLGDLGDLYFLASYVRDDIQFGPDLLFWAHFTQALKQVLLRDQYVPALKYRDSPRKLRGKRKTATGYEIYPAWEIVSQDYESRIQRALEAMPLACVAAAETVHEVPVLYDKEGLLRQYSECVLTALLRSTSFPAVFARKINQSLLHDCIHLAGIKPLRSHPKSLERYYQWQTWQQALTVHHNRGFQLCFQLLEGEHDKAPWRIQFLATARHDPSLRLPLGDYWDLGTKAHKTLVNSLGNDFEQQLMRELGLAARMYPRLWQGMETERPVGLEISLDEAFEFLKGYAWVLEDAGFKVIVPAWWTPQGRQRVRLRIKASGRKAESGTTAGPGYFSLDTLVKYRFELAIGGQAVTEEEWRQLVEAKTPLVQFRGEWIELDRDKMQQLLDFWHRHGQDDAEMSFGELLHKAAVDEDDVDLSQDSALAERLHRLQNPSHFQPIADPPEINGTLRDYQKRGVAWIQYLENLGLNGCLADDMGLGKTLQVITCLATIRTTSRAPTLLIAPTSVLGNWQKEVEKFAPQLSTLMHHGGTREQVATAFLRSCNEIDLVITSFSLARRDIKLLQVVNWERIVVDEAQNIKNPKTAQTRAILRLKAQHRLALTGTPVENRLLDLWSIFNFLNPGYLGSQTRFRKQFELPIQRSNDLAKSTILKKLVQPFALRRVKTDKNIIKDLPDKVEHKQYCNLTKEQGSLYEAVVNEVERTLDEAEGMQRRGLILATLMKLKQICNHPRQFLQDNSAFTPQRSQKLTRLTEMLEEVFAEGESLLIFTQFTEIGAALQTYLSQTRGYSTFYLHGGTSRKQRERMIKTFQDPEGEPSAFVLSLKAGGVGINLTRANHVFHFDRWWNPAVEDQATDRVFRIGQLRNVFVHKFVTLGTVEERIDQMIEDKKRVASAIIGSDESWLTELDNESFKRLIALNENAIVE